MWFRCCVFVTCSQVAGLTVTVIGSGTLRDTLSGRTAVLAYSTTPADGHRQCVTVTQS